MKLTYNAKSPGRVEVLLQPGDVLEVDPELGARLQAASAHLQEPKATRKPARKPTGKAAS